MPEVEDIIDKIAKIFINEGVIATKSELSPGLKLDEDLGLDSFGFINLVMQLNSAFLINIKSTEIIPENFSTVAKLQEFITAKKITQ